MSLAVLALAVVLLAVMEKIWTPKALESLRFHGGCDKICAEPGETVTWNAVVENTARLPVPFVRLQESFPDYALVNAEEGWIKTHCRSGIRKWHVEEKMSLMPGKGCTKSVRFSFSGRGVYSVGSYRLSAGDLLGLGEKFREGDGQSIVIIPSRAASRHAEDVLGGFLGDISVRRFILEDPVLTVGFRDYTGREPLKAVSWTRTAMTGSLQVKQFDHTAEQNVMILLNVEGGTAEQLEGCFRLTRTVCEELEKKKIPFGLRTNGNLPGPVGNIFYLAGGLGSRHVGTILYALGRADYTCFYSFQYLSRQTLLHRKNNESYIVITPSMTEQTSRILRTLETAVGSGVCVLTGETEANAV